MIPDFETWYEQLTDNDIWFDTMKVQHGGAGRIREAAQLVYGDYVGNPKMFPAPESARSHIHYKLARMPRRIETNYQHEKKEDNFSNPLTDEQKKEVDKLLEQYKNEIKGMETKAIPKMTHSQIAEEGQWLPKKEEPYKVDHLRAHMKEAITKASKDFYRVRSVNLSDVSGFSLYEINGYEIFAKSDEHADIIYNEACEMLLAKANVKSINE